MGSLSNIVNIAITTQSAGVQVASFDVPLIADYHTKFAERFRTYSSLAGMLTDGFTVNDAAYLAAEKMIAQNPRVRTFAIGRKALAPDMQVDFTPVAANLTVYRMKLRGPTGLTGTASFTSDGTATVAEIVAGLVSAINTLALGITATDQTTFMRLKASSAGLWFSAFAVDAAGNPTRILGQTKQTHADPGIATDMAAIALENSSFYGVESTTASTAEITALATWVESNKKISAQSSQNTDIPAAPTTDVASALKTANDFRTAVHFHDDPGQFLGAALLGSVFPVDPGGVIAKFRKLASVSTVPLTESEIANLTAKNANSFTTFGGVGITFNGRMAAGEWFDVIRDRDWLEATMQADVFNVFANSNKVPFTDGGISQVVAAIRARLGIAVSAGFLAEDPAPVVTAPRASAVSPADKAARNLTGVSFTGTIAGAIQATTISGTVSL